MNPSQNPFTAMLLTFNPARIYGREQELTNILQVITAPEPNSYAIFGMRTIGKTTLLKYLKDKRGALHHYRDSLDMEYQPGGGRRLIFTYVGFRRFQPNDNLFYTILNTLRDDLMYDTLSSEIVIPRWDTIPPKQEIIHALRDILGVLDRHGVRVVFLFDDFDIPLPYISLEDDRLLRVLNDDAVLIIATETPIAVLRPDMGESSPLLGILRPEALGPLTEAAARRLISEPLQTIGVTLDETEQQFLIDIAGRQPFLLTAACELYFDLLLEHPDIVDLFRDPVSYRNIERHFIARLASLPHVNNILSRIWDSLNDEEQHCLYNIAFSNLASGVRRNLIARLENNFLISADFRTENYRMFSKLFVDFVQRLYSAQTKTSQQTLTDTAAQIADTLSPVDRAVFEYLFRHANQVCTFEDIQESVWEDSSPAAKRALEAAVYRLRKSLSHYAQIKNVRGQGYRLIVAPKPARRVTR